MSHGPSKQAQADLDGAGSHSGKNAADGLGEPHPRELGWGVLLPLTPIPQRHIAKESQGVSGVALYTSLAYVSIWHPCISTTLWRVKHEQRCEAMRATRPTRPSAIPCWSARMKWERSGNLWGNYRDQLSADAVTAWLAAYYQGRSEGETSSASFLFFLVKKNTTDSKSKLVLLQEESSHTAEARRTLYVLQYIWTDNIMKKSRIGPKRTTVGPDHSAAYWPARLLQLFQI